MTCNGTKCATKFKEPIEQAPKPLESNAKIWTIIAGDLSDFRPQKPKFCPGLFWMGHVSISFGQSNVNETCSNENSDKTPKQRWLLFHVACLPPHPTHS